MLVRNDLGMKTSVRLVPIVVAVTMLPLIAGYDHIPAVISLPSRGLLKVRHRDD